jgi:hypothetical protein
MHNISKPCKFSFELTGASAMHNINACNNSPDPNFNLPINSIEQIIEVIGKHCNMPTPPKFSFKQIRAAATHNISILSKCEFNIRRALEANKDSLFSPGKEFKLPDKLRKVFCLHPLWPKMETILKNRSKWPLTEIRKKERQQEVLNALTFGNHKGALAKLELL